MKLKFLLFLLLTMFLGADSIKLPVSFDSSFTQEIISPKNKKILYKGRVLYSDKSLLKWIYSSPTKKDVCTNGKELVVVDNDLEQVSFYTINKGFNLPEVLKSAKKDNNGIFLATYQKKIYSIKLNQNGELFQVSYNDDLDNKVTITFDEIKYKNSSIPAEKLKCIIPKNYDISRG
ncbi:MAG: LolA-like outer membrane lipoprotein chaperone [Sulfurovaceae bacterium]|nr:LolA-like outer membrane lipoprotein chaperone [Sulfurovaceae bacterium]MDD5548263.1 LolA-like outer membrane lipoprotein chaperone [Sulfurovaceae bacterium]